MTSIVQEQVQKNYEAFQTQLHDLTSQRGKFALMKDRQIVAFFDTARDACITGHKLYSDHLFSVQEVIETPINLGFFSYVVPQQSV